MNLGLEIKGQATAINQLNAMLRQEQKLAHAFIFIGPAGVGKTRIALALAAALLGQPYINHPDLLIPERQGNTIKISEIRSLQEWLSFKPYAAQRKIVIIPEAHLMTTEAANALLKTLEDPPGDALLILVADQESLPLTIVSRCQIVRFKSLTEEEVYSILVTEGIEEERAKLLAVVCGGSPGKALVMQELNITGIVQRVVSLLCSLGEGDSLAALETAELIEKDTVQRDTLLTVLEVCLRDALLTETGITGRNLIIPVETAEKLGAIGIKGLKKAIMMVNQARRRLAGNANPLILQTNLFLQMGEVFKEVI
ncbi:MAG: ATP-binding protein [Chitinophagales bacterium]